MPPKIKSVANKKKKKTDKGTSSVGNRNIKTKKLPDKSHPIQPVAEKCEKVQPVAEECEKVQPVAEECNASDNVKVQPLKAPQPPWLQQKRIAIFAPTCWNEWMEGICRDSKHDILCCPDINSNDIALAKIKELGDLKDHFSCIVFAPCHGHLRMFFAIWNDMVRQKSENLLPLLALIAELGLTDHVHFDTCNLGRFGAEYMLSPFINLKISKISGYGGGVGSQKDGGGTEPYIGSGCPTTLPLGSYNAKNESQHQWLIWSREETKNKMKLDPFRSNTKWPVNFPKKDMSDIFQQSLTDVDRQAGVIQHQLTSLQQNYIMSKLSPGMEDDPQCFAKDDEYDYVPDLHTSTDIIHLRKMLQDLDPPPLPGSMQQVHLSQVVLNFFRSYTTMEPLMLHLYADMTSMKATHLSDIIRTEHEMDPCKWQINRLNSIYVQLIELKKNFVAAGNKKRKAVLCFNVNFILRGRKTEQHATHVTLQWYRDDVIAVYEDLGYTAAQCRADSTGVIKGRKEKLLERKYKYSHRIKVSVEQELKALGITMKHETQYPLQPYFTNTCCIALMFKIHFSNISDSDRYKLLNSFRWHPDYQALYKMVLENTPQTAADVDDRVPQLLMLKLYDQWLYTTFPKMMSNSADFASLYEVENCKLHEMGICGICHQVDSPKEMMSCNTNVEHKCIKSCAKQCKRVCGVYEHTFCSPSTDHVDKWYCASCCV